MLEKNADYYIQKLNLNTHVEGGAFRETYRSKLKIEQRNSSQMYNQRLVLQKQVRQ